MSGYFARLASQLQSPAASLRRGVATAALERHTEVDASVPVQVRGDASGERTEQAPAMSQAHATLPNASPATPRQAPVTAAADHTASSPFTPGMPIQREALTAAMPPHESPAAQAQPMAFKPTAIDSPTIAPSRRQSADAEAARPSSDRVPTRSRTETTMTPASIVLSQPPLAQPQARLPAHRESTQHMHTADREARASSAFIQPTDRPQAAERAHAIAPRLATPSTPAAPIVQSTVRIGTITLEVHPPAVTAPVAPQPVAAAPTPAPSQFSLRRHHVRWS